MQISNVKWSQVKPDLEGKGSDSLASGGESLTINAVLDAKAASK